MINSENMPLSLVLVVDDNPQNLQLIGGVLGGEAGYDLCFAGSAEEALDIMSVITPDLILLDVNMPGKNGFDFCSELREREATRDLPIIFLTAQSDTESIVRGFDAGGSDYVKKPFAPQELKARVGAHLMLKMRTDQLKEANARVRRLEGIIPICMYCKKIREVDRSWSALEQYFSEHSDARFSHGICPECFSEQEQKLGLKE